MLCKYDQWKLYAGEDETYTGCDECEKKNHDLKQAYGHFQDVLEYAYGKKPFDPNDFHLILQELLLYFNSKEKTFDDEIKLTAKSETPDFVKDWVEFNNNYLKQA